MKVELRIDAHELDQKPADSGKHEVQAGEPAYRLRPLGQLPEQPEQHKREEEFVDGRRLNERIRRSRRHKCILRHVHAPRQRGVNAVVAIAGQQAADPADAIADSRCGRGQIEHPDRANARAWDGAGIFDGLPSGTFEACALALHDQHGDAGEHAAEPGKAVPKPLKKAQHNVQGVMPTGAGNIVKRQLKLVKVLQLMPHLCANHARDDNECDNIQCVRIDAIACKVLVQHDGPSHRREPQQQPEHSKMHRANIQIGVHKPRFC